MKPIRNAHRCGLVTEGIAMIVLGLAAMLLPVFATLGITLLIGVILLVAGFLKVVRSVQFRAWPGFRWSLVGGLLLAAGGLFFLAYPEKSAGLLTIILAVLFLLEGLWEVAFAMQFREVGVWKWILASGIASLVIALLLLLSWPSSAAWAIGLLVGINLLFTGVWLLLVCSASRTFPELELPDHIPEAV